MPAKVAIEENDFPFPSFKLLAKGSLIDKGPNGKVYQAKTPKGNRGVIKEVTLGHLDADGEEMRERFLEELFSRVDELVDLEHEHLVPYYGAHRITGAVQVYSELGKPKLECTAPMAEEKVQVLTKQILSALVYLHEKGLPHGSLKPENILVSADLEIKLSDYATCRLLRDIFQPTTGFSSINIAPHYMAPEVLQGKDYDDIVADIWSLGCCVAQMLAGARPWSAKKNDAAIMMAIMKTQELPCSLDGISDNAKDFLTKCLERKPDSRADAVTLLEHPFVN